jgi:hypothetical protein
VGLLYVTVLSVDFCDLASPHRIEGFPREKMSLDRNRTGFDRIARGNTADDESAIGKLTDIEAHRDVGFPDIPKLSDALVARVEGAVSV